MKKLTITAIISLVLCNGLLSQTKIDSTIFINNFEKKTFEVALDSLKTPDYISLMLAPDSTVTMTNVNEVKAYINEVNKWFIEKSLASKSITKQAKEIYKAVHQEKFRKYENIAYFPEIFRNGNYNCVTASALYSLVLEQLKIPYEIKEKPTHVYLIVAPKTDNILFETTSPESGIYNYNDKFISSYIEHLKNNKIISQTEINTHSANELFNKYYFGENQTITLKQLCGLQYYNLGVANLDSKEYFKAIKALEKAELLYPSERNKFLLTGLTPELLEQNIPYQTKGKYLGKMTIYTKDPTTLKYIEDKFKEVSNELIINRPNIANYNIFCDNFFCYVKDSSLHNQLAFIQHYLLADFYQSKSNDNKCLSELTLAYRFNTENIYLRNSIKEALRKRWFSQNKDEIEADTIEHYMNTFDFLKNELMFQGAYCYTFFKKMKKAYEADDVINGEKYLHEFLKSIDKFQFQKPEVKDDMIGNAYGEISAYYFRKNQYAKSKEWINEGLKLVPNNDELKRKLEMVNAYHPIIIVPKPTPKPTTKKRGTAIAY